VTALGNQGLCGDVGAMREGPVPGAVRSWRVLRPHVVTLASGKVLIT
jgi:hypothetical protein